MNLLFLVEGGKTEPKVYKAWLSHLLPNISFVTRPEDMTHNCCRIIPGNGYPNMVSSPKASGQVSLLEACLKDCIDYNNVDHFFICLDSEDDSYELRLNEVSAKVEHYQSLLGMDGGQNTQIHIIIQNCCLETWALGNKDIPIRYSRDNVDTDFYEFQKYFDILHLDPETMECCPPDFPFSTKARFHDKYLREYLRQYGLRYTKRNPQVLGERDYLDSLIDRYQSTHHLKSLRYFLEIIQGIHWS